MNSKIAESYFLATGSQANVPNYSVFSTYAEVLLSASD